MKNKKHLVSGYVPMAAVAFVSATAFGNVVGPDAQNFNPTTNGIDYVTVQSSDTLLPGIINLGAFLNYAVNSLPVGEDVNQNRMQFNDTLLMSDFNFGIGLLKGWDVGFSYPRLMRQVIDTDGARGQFSSTGNTELRFNTKIRFYEKRSLGAAIVLSANINRIVNNPFTGIDPGPSINTELVVDREIGPFKAAVNLGYRARNAGEPIPDSVIKPTRDQIIASLGGSYFSSALDTKFIAEIYGSQAANTDAPSAFNRQASSAEMIFGAKHDWTSSLALHGGAGTELIQGAASPDWRIYCGVNWNFGPVFERRESVVLVEETIVEETNSYLELKPDEPLGPVTKGETTVRSYSIKFKFDSTDVTEDSKEAIGQLAAFLQKPPVFQSLTIEGHTDSVGPEAYNMSLSLKRAESIRKILVSKYELAMGKIKIVGFGESKPIADNGNYQGRQLNRRVDFVITR